MSRYFPTPQECGHHTVFGKVPIRTYAGDHLQMSIVTIPADGLVDWHAHVNEQMGIVISGRAEFHIGDEVKTLGEGEIFLIPGNIRHKVVPVGGEMRAVDFFYPIRDEYR